MLKKCGSAMRIALTNWSNRRVGGAETYLAHTIDGLEAAGHQVALFHEMDGPLDRKRLLDGHVPSWSVDRLGREAALVAMRDWKPDLVYAHGLMQPDLETAADSVAPAVHFVHAYYGTCITGAKTLTQPVVQPCERAFGWACLGHFYPCRCGGLNPRTMWQEFSRHRHRLALLGRSRALVVLSEHMRTEYVRHGFRAERVYNVSPSSEATGLAAPRAGTELRHSAGPLRCAFAGRMDVLKGGRTLLEALPAMADALARPVSMTFVGDGPDRGRWERDAEALRSRRSDITIAFEPWRNEADLQPFFATQDLLIVPSLWPEPFGRVGLEAGRQGVPAVAFDVGGISEWLKDGVNGRLAPGRPPTASGLAHAVVRAVADAREHARLSAGARALAMRADAVDHVAHLTRIFAEALADQTPLRVLSA